jgi:hypothetical protein
VSKYKTVAPKYLIFHVCRQRHKTINRELKLPVARDVVPYYRVLLPTQSALLDWAHTTYPAQLNSANAP